MRSPEPHVGKDGKTTWKVRFRYGVSPKTRKPKQCSETFDRKTEADQFAKELDILGPREALRRLHDGFQRSTVPTLNDVAADHIRFRTGIEDGTRLNYTRLWDRTWGPRIGHLPADEVTDDQIAVATNDLARHYSQKSLENQRGLLAAVCQRAVAKGYLAMNPTKDLRLPRASEVSQTEMRILTQDEFAGIVEHAAPHYQPLLVFLGATGCRWGEAVALLVGDVNLDLGSVRIRRALKWSPDNDRKIGPTKTKKSNRTIVLPPESIADMRVAIGDKDNASLVFTAPKGGPVLHRTFWSRVWHPAVEAAKIAPPRPRIHDIRHSHASWLLAAGVPIHVVQARLGHESIQTTVDTYGGLLPDAQTQAARAASLAFTHTRRIGPT